MGACATEDDPEVTGDPEIGTEDQSASAATQGAISAPQIAYAGSSRCTAQANGGMTIDGGSEEGAFALARYSATAGSGSATARFVVKPASGAAFQYTLAGSGSGYSTKNLRVERVPGKETVQATTSTGVIVTCGAVPSNTATQVTLAFDATTATFDVLIGGRATACTDLATKFKPPVVGFNLMDASNAGYGGHVEFTNLSIQ